MLRERRYTPTCNDDEGTQTLTSILSELKSRQQQMNTAITHLSSAINSPQNLEPRLGVVHCLLFNNATVSTASWDEGPGGGYEQPGCDIVNVSPLLDLPIERVGSDDMKDCLVESLVLRYQEMWTKILALVRMHSCAYVHNYGEFRDRLRSCFQDGNLEDMFALMNKARPWHGVTFHMSNFSRMFTLKSSIEGFVKRVLAIPKAGLFHDIAVQLLDVCAIDHSILFLARACDFATPLDNDLAWNDVDRLGDVNIDLVRHMVCAESIVPYPTVIYEQFFQRIFPHWEVRRP